MIAAPVETYPHLAIDGAGTATIAGTTTKVIEVALDRIAHHWDADEIQRQHPHLSLSQIHAALAYYCDHQTELDAVIAAQLDRVAALRSQTENLTLRQKLLDSAMKLDRITSTSARMNGQPCVRDLRLTVRRVVELVALYPDRAELRREFPELDEEDIRQALAYATASRFVALEGTGPVNAYPLDWLALFGSLADDELFVAPNRTATSTTP